jgi:hypothetical protein
MKLFYFLLLQFVVFSFCDAQTLCAKTFVIKPVFTTEIVEIVISPAVYETRFIEMTIKQGFWDVEKKNGADCKVWKNPETVTVAKQVITVPAVTKMITTQKVERHGDLITYMSDCQ